MKKVYKLIAAASLSLMTIGVFAQSAKNVPVTGHHFTNNPKSGSAKILSRKPQAASSTIILNYDSADATVWQSLSTTFYHSQGQLMNSYYKYPKDTVGSNFNIINYVGVVFDTIVDPYSPPNTPGVAAMGLTVDTIIIPIVHNNTTGLVDTLDVQLFAANQWGYPTSTLLKDYMIIGTKISDTNNSSIIGTALAPMNTVVAAPGKFYVQVTYKGSKKDSCWFIYGFGGFSGACAGGTYTLADSTNFSTIKYNGGKNQFTANSFEYWNEYKAFLPDSNGGGIFYPCGANDSTFVAGDGDSYFEDVDIYAQVTFVNTVGINNVTANGFNVAQNQPNPFNQSTVINYNLTKSSDVVFSVYDMTGRKIMENAYNEAAPGQHTITLGANKFSAGVYFYSFNVNGNVVTKKMVITE